MMYLLAGRSVPTRGGEVGERERGEVGLAGLWLDRARHDGSFEEDSQGWIALITSATGAARHDMIRSIRDRFPPADIVFIGASVQGDGTQAHQGDKAHQPLLTAKHHPYD